MLKVLFFCNELNSAQILFELIRLRCFAGMVIPKENRALIKTIIESGYVSGDKIFTPEKGDLSSIELIISKVKPDIGLIATFPMIFPEEIYSQPKYGIYNMHYGLLPGYRSADPVFWQIKNKEKHGGVSIIKLDESLDGGPIVMNETFAITPFDNYAIVLHKSAILACQLIEKLLVNIENENLVLKQQHVIRGNYLPKPKLKDVQINWNDMSAAEIVATVNAGNPWNKGAITSINDEEIRIVQVTPANYNKELPDSPGEVFISDPTQGVFTLCKDKELLRIDCIYSNNGYTSGGMILCTGIRSGSRFI